MGLSKGSEGQVEGSEGQPEGSEGFEGQLEGSEGQPEGSEGQPEGSEGLPEGSEGQPEGSEGQPEGSEGQPGEWMDIFEDISADRIFPDSAGPCPLMGPLPKLAWEKEQKEVRTQKGSKERNGRR